MIWTYLILKIAYNAFYAGQVSCIYIYIAYLLYYYLLYIIIVNIITKYLILNLNK